MVSGHGVATILLIRGTRTSVPVFICSIHDLALPTLCIRLAKLVIAHSSQKKKVPQQQGFCPLKTEVDTKLRGTNQVFSVCKDRPPKAQRNPPPACRKWRRNLLSATLSLILIQKDPSRQTNSGSAGKPVREWESIFGGTARPMACVLML